MDIENVNQIIENDSQAREREDKLNKRIQVYKDTMTLIKLKMNKADALIRQYNDKMKECDSLNEELSSVKTEKQDILRKYNLTMEKMTKLELTNLDNKSSFEKYKEITDKQKIKLDENEKHINQLIFKVKSTEDQNLTLEDKVKSLEQEIKCARITLKSFSKKNQVHSKEQASQTISLKKQDIAVITDPIIHVSKKLQMEDKITMTDTYFQREKEPFPIFCTKCEDHIIPTPVEQILKVMSLSPPFLSEYLSPPNSPKLSRPYDEINEFKNNAMIMGNENNEIVPYLSHAEQNQNVSEIDEKPKQLSFMELDKLMRKMNKLENLIKEKRIKEKKNNCYHHNCCSSKNIKFILQLPNEEKFFELRKHEKRKVKRLYHQKKKNTTVNKGINKNDWLVEDSSKSRKRKTILNVKENLSSKKRKYLDENSINNLFDSSAIHVPNGTSNDYLNKDTFNSKESLSPIKFQELGAQKFSSAKERIEIDVNVIGNTVAKDVNIDEFVLKLRSTSCNSATSQASLCENIFQTSIENINIPKEDIVDKINENVSYDKDILPIRIESIEKPAASKSIVAILDNEMKYSDSVIEASNYKYNINESVPTENGNIISEKLYTSYVSNTIDQHQVNNEHQVMKNVNNEQKQNSKLHDTSEQNNLYDQKSEGSTSVFHESNDLVYAEKNESVVNSNVTNKQTESTDSDSNFLNETSISEISSNSKHLSINENINEDVVEEQSKLEEKLTCDKDNIVSNESSMAYTSKIVHAEYKSVNEDIKEENLQAPNARIKRIKRCKQTADCSINKIQKNDLDFEEQNNAFDKSINETSILSNESLEVSFTSLTSEDKICNNESEINLSDECDAEKNIKSPRTRTRNKLSENCATNFPDGNRKKLLSKIRNIRKNSKESKILKLETGISQIKEKLNHLSKSIESEEGSPQVLSKLSNKLSPLIESVTTSVVPIKQRIAHTPKSINVNKNNKSSNQVRKVIKKTKSVSKEETEDAGDKVSSIIKEINKNFKGKAQEPISLNDTKPKVLDSLTSLNALADSNPSTLNQENVFESLKPVNPGNDNVTNDNVDNVNESNENTDTADSKTTLLKTNSRKVKASKLFNKLNDTHEDAPDAESGSAAEDTIVTEEQAPTKDTSDVEGKSPIRALRSRQITISSECSTPKRKKPKPRPPKQITQKNSSLCNTTILSCLNECLSNPKDMNKYYKVKIDANKFMRNGKFTKDQLDRLIEAEEWTAELQNEIVESLVTKQDIKYTAYFLIEYAADQKLEDDSFDKSHTPPAPVMTRAEQKLVTLIIEIDKRVPEFYDIIVQGIQYRVFKFNAAKQVQTVERLFRILVVLSKIKKDREKVRILCCDALYCLNFRAVNIFYVTLTCWPEILPKFDSNNDIIVKTIVHVIMTLQTDTPSSRLNSLRKLLFSYYNYPNSGYMPNNIKTELLKNLQENTPGIKTAILLLCKRMGPDWTLQNIVKELKQIIVTQAHPSLYEVLTLLGWILRSFPINVSFKEIFETIDQLCDVLDNSTGADDLQESILSCLISISKFNFEQVARFVLKCKFDKELRPSTKEKLKSFFKCHDAKWWWKFVRQNFPPSKLN